MPNESESAITAGELIDQVASQFAAADLFYGHGTDNPDDEAAALVFHVLGLDFRGTAAQYARPATAAERKQVVALAERRIATREPLPYLLGEAWFAGHRFAVSRDVLIPRSPIAELIAERFVPWLNPEAVGAILEVGAGSGCIAIACALAFPKARVVATEISPAALAVAARNVADYNLQQRIELVETDLLDEVTGCFDLIVANPPYVPQAEMAELPAEYAHEPELALVSGVDGLDSARRILQDAAHCLTPAGILVLEVGEQWEALQEAYPSLPFHWLEFEYGGIGVGLLEAAALKAS
jgi:ribosomal protein L3 glutamine methyltransferase